LPVSLLEAAACGRPMIATDVPGCREVVIDGETGLLVPLGDVQALADALEKLVASEELRQRHGAGARDLVERHYSLDVISDRVAGLYRSLVRDGVQARAGG
jgi:glycosyltransferase involved in cell wall biosynthesis